MNDTVALVKEKTVIAARAVAPYVKPTVRFVTVWTVLGCAWMLAAMLWMFQYGLIVPLQFVWRLFTGLGGAAILALIPIFGWIALIVIANARIKKDIPVLGEKNYSTRPWLLEPLLSIKR